MEFYSYMILIIDHYDSFTQNLAQYVGCLGFDIIISRNDELTIEEVQLINPTHIILSPGPGSPQSTGLSLNLIKSNFNQIPILGVCLGHQIIGYAYGCRIKQLDLPMHGKISQVWHNNSDIFVDLPNPFFATRYHSLVVDNYKLPTNIEITAWTQDGIIMACRHKYFNNLNGVQFHPESLWTQDGQKIIQNFLLN